MKKVQNVAEREKAVDVLTSAFAKDPVTLYMSDAEASRRAFFNMSVKHLIQNTYLFENKAVAVWYKSGEANKKSVWQYIKSPISFCQMMYHASFTKIKELTSVMDRAEKIEKKKLEGIAQYYYIYFLGVDPHHQGQRLGSKILDEITSKADQDNMPVLLEASSERSRKLYLRHGFEEFDQMAMRDDPSVRIWLMLRPAKSSSK